MHKVKDIFEFINSHSPFDTQESWDNSGMLVGDKNAEVKNIGVSLDVTDEIITQAVDKNIDLLVTHHPVIFKPQKTVLSDSLVYKAIKNNLSIISCHTPFDLSTVSKTLAVKIGLTDIMDNEFEPMVKIGKINPINSYDFAKQVKTNLNSENVRCNRIDKNIGTVAVCGGSGASLMGDLSGVDAFVTGDASHHDFLDATDTGLFLVAAGHFETESISMPYMQSILQNEFKDINVILLEEKSPIITIQE